MLDMHDVLVQKSAKIGLILMMNISCNDCTDRAQQFMAPASGTDSGAPVPDAGLMLHLPTMANWAFRAIFLLP
jgi:hypothetical protein